MQSRISHVETVGLRLLAVRNKAGFSQAKMASVLLISDQAYKNYELGKRELPLNVAAKVCIEFDVSLDWLVFNERPELETRNLDLISEVSKVSYDLTRNDVNAMAADKFGNFVAYVYQQSLGTGTRPREIALSILAIFR